MCGRLALSLKLNEIQNCCKYSTLDSDGLVKPEIFKVDNLGNKFQPSFNIPPIQILPVLVSKKYFDPLADSSQIVMVEMLWGLIPRWHQGNYKEHGYNGTNNCRIENLMSSKMYLPALQKGQRCVALCEGFFHWQNTALGLRNFQKPVYYLHHPHSMKMESNEEEDEEERGSSNLRLLRIAGIFDVWYDSEGKEMYSFTIITQEAGSNINWLHNRIPAILETEQQVTDWLDYERVAYQSAIKLIRKPTNIFWHQVSTLVNNTNNKSEKCIQPIANEQKRVDIKSPIKRINLKTSLKRKASKELKRNDERNKKNKK